MMVKVKVKHFAGLATGQDSYEALLTSMFILKFSPKLNEQ